MEIVLASGKLFKNIKVSILSLSSQISISSHPGTGLTPSTNTLSVRQTRWTVSCPDQDNLSVLSLGQLDVRMCRGQAGHQVDLMVNVTTYTQILLELVLDVREFIRPVLFQLQENLRLLQ